MKKSNAYDAIVRNLPSNWRKGFEGRYVPACGGKEEPVYRNGKWWLLVWDKEDRKHLHYCYEDDIYHEV